MNTRRQAQLELSFYPRMTDRFRIIHWWKFRVALEGGRTMDSYSPEVSTRVVCLVRQWTTDVSFFTRND